MKTKREKGKGVEAAAEGSGLLFGVAEAEPAAPVKSSMRRCGKEEMLVYAREKIPDLPEGEVARCWQYWQDLGWEDSRGPVRDWRKRLATWAGNWREREAERKSRHPIAASWGKTPFAAHHRVVGTVSEEDIAKMGM